MELNTDLILGEAHKLHNNTNKPIKDCIIEALHNTYDTVFYRFVSVVV